MSLNIKNEEAYNLASQLAQATGKSMTAVVPRCTALGVE